LKSLANSLINKIAPAKKRLTPEGPGGTFRLAFESESDSEKTKKVIEDIGFSTNA
jgi:hypothetical protein